MIKNLNFSLLLILMFAIGIISLLGYAGEYLDVAELISHFRFLYFLVTLLLVVPVAFVRRKKIVLSWIFLLVLTILPMMPLIIQVDHSLVPADAAHIKILQMNLWGGKNSNQDAVLENVRKFDPDILVFSEITRKWANIFDTALSAYPYRNIEPRFGGIAVYSKNPLLGTKVMYYGNVRRPRIETTVQTKNGKFLLIAAHTFIPKYMAIRNGELNEIATRAAKSEIPVVLAGDLNCSPWSYYFAKLQRDGNLVDTEPGFGLQCSWPTSVLERFQTPPFIPIDHFLVSDRFLVINRTLGAKDGSDHLPVFLELVLPKSEH
ncbi:MAG TPA: endonuclease/exonuclease/phosphatase family protein [Drouetiella sp.]|jgi:endonuclease/exonuclease/phosphatase (EEP) superfamily protein YafD